MDCGAPSDPVSGYCAACEPGEPVLFRVTALSNEWFRGDGPAPAAPEAVVSERTVPEQVRRFLDEDTSLILVQRLEG